MICITLCAGMAKKRLKLCSVEDDMEIPTHEMDDDDDVTHEMDDDVDQVDSNEVASRTTGIP